MTNYIVHLYREMRLTYTGIEADTPETAAALAGGKPTDDADNIEDCEGENLSALVDVAGDDEYELSRCIDFETERQRKAAPKLLAALEAFLEADELAEQCHEWKWENLEPAFALARVAIAEANATGIEPFPAEIDIHALLAQRRQIAAIWSVEDVRAVAPNLTDEQCWDVLQQAERRHDAEIGINWSVLIGHADTLLGEAADTAAAGEQ